MGKRKRAEAENHTPEIAKHHKHSTPLSKTDTVGEQNEGRSNSGATIQIITGSYEKILHGVVATVLPHVNGNKKDNSQTIFVDNFLFNAHGSAVRCLAISPPSTSQNISTSQKAILASGSSDQIINLYHIATSLPHHKEVAPLLPLLGGKRSAENSTNRELGSLQHHSSCINALCFPSRSKLLSAAEDNTIAVTRTRDWTVLSTIKAPIPKAHGRPSGDTAPLGGAPTGVNDIAIHPSMKLMVSVGKGEKCMRLWNLVTGKKAGVLNFEKQLLQGIGEGRWGSGEGRKIAWNLLGEEFVVGFERGAAVFGMDSKPRYRLLPSPLTKIHQLRYVQIPKSNSQASEFLAMSTDDGRILLYITEISNSFEKTHIDPKLDIPILKAFGQIGGIGENVLGRIKDFEILNLKSPDGPSECLIVVAGSSDGLIRLWKVDEADLSEIRLPLESKITSNGDNASKHVASIDPPKQLGHLIGVYETGNRITCLKAFVMLESVTADDTQTKSELINIENGSEVVNPGSIIGS